MKISICGSMAFAKEMLDAKNKLEKKGHKVFVSDFAELFLGKSEAEKAALNRKNVVEHDAIIEHWDKIKKSDAILVLNYIRHGIKNYIGGNTFLEIGFAYVLKKKIFLLNPVPKISYYEAEIAGMKPVILNGDLAMFDVVV